MRGEIVDAKKRRKKQMCVFLKGKNAKTCQANAQEKKDQIIMAMSGKVWTQEKKNV